MSQKYVTISDFSSVVTMCISLRFSAIEQKSSFLRKLSANFLIMVCNRENERNRASLVNDKEIKFKYIHAKHLQLMTPKMALNDNKERPEIIIEI